MNEFEATLLELVDLFHQCIKHMQQITIVKIVWNSFNNIHSVYQFFFSCTKKPMLRSVGSMSIFSQPHR